MVSDRQVRWLRKKRTEGKTLEAAASAAAMSERTARAWPHGALPSETKEPRTWRTRPDPFVEVWAMEIEQLRVSEKDGKLEAKTIFAKLCRKKPGVFEAGQLRTLQRRVREWWAERGPDKDVYFPQEHLPGRIASMDFTHATELGVTIAGVLFVYMFFELVLAYSGWRFVQLAFGETFEALVKDLQGGLWALGGAQEGAAGQPLGGDARAGEDGRARADAALRRRRHALRLSVVAHPARGVAREWRRGEGASPAQERALAGAASS